MLFHYFTCGEQVEDERHIFFECRFCNISRGKYPLLFRDSAPGDMNKFMNQADQYNFAFFIYIRAWCVNLPYWDQTRAELLNLHHWMNMNYTTGLMTRRLHEELRKQGTMMTGFELGEIWCTPCSRSRRNRGVENTKGMNVLVSLRTSNSKELYHLCVLIIPFALFLIGFSRYIF